MATALCKLQLKLKRSSRIENFQSRTPPIREPERKRRKKKSVRVQLEIRFVEDELEDPNLEIYTSSDVTHLQADENLSSIPLVASETGSMCESSDVSEFSLRNAPLLEDCIGDFPTPEELTNLDERSLAKLWCSMNCAYEVDVFHSPGAPDALVCRCNRKCAGVSM
jgi:hypothetical protein